MEGSGGTFRVGAPGRGSSHPEVQDSETQWPSLSLGTFGVALIRPFAGLRGFGDPTGHRGSRCSLGDESWALRVLGQTKEGLGPARPEWGKGPNRWCAQGAARRGGRR